MVAPQAITPCVAEVDEMGDAAAQHERGARARVACESGSWRPSALIHPFSALTTRAAARRTSMVSGIPKSVEKAAHRSFGGDAAVLGPADPVGDRCHHLPARLEQMAPTTAAAKSSLCLRGPFSRRSDARPHAGIALCHGNRSAQPVGRGRRRPRRR